MWAAAGDRTPYNSWGNGSAMRAPAIGYAFDSLEEVCEEARRSAAVTHDHPEGIKGAQATAAAVFLARTRKTKDEIRDAVETRFCYDLRRRLDDIRPGYRFNESCQHTVPEAIVAFLESNDYEDAVRKAISLGGDADTLACITGAIAEPFYGGVPQPIARRTRDLLDERLRGTVLTFCERYGIATPP